MSKGRAMKWLWWVVGALLGLIVLAVVVKVATETGGAASLRAPADAVRPWASGEFNAASTPGPSAGRGNDPRYLCEIHSVNVVPDAADATAAKIMVEADGNVDTWVPTYRGMLLEAGNGFAFDEGDGRRGKVTWVATATLGEQELERASGSGGRLPLTPFTPQMEPLGDEQAAALGLKEGGHHLRAWVQAGEPVTVLKFGVEIEGYDDVKWQLEGFYDRRTQVRLSNGGAWTSTGDEARFESDLFCVHDVSVRALVDFSHGPVERFPLAPQSGAAVDGDDFRVEVVAIESGSVDSWGSGGAASGRDEYRFDLKAIGGETTALILAISPDVADHAISLNVTGKDGERIDVRGNGSSGFLRTMSLGAKPEAIGEIEVVYRPNFTRLVVDFPPAGGVPAANAGAVDLFDCVIPAGEVDSEYELRQLVAELTQLELNASAVTSRTIEPMFPLDVGGLTVRGLVEEYLLVRPEVAVTVDPVELKLQVGDPVTVPWWERVAKTVGGWF